MILASNAGQGASQLRFQVVRDALDHNTLKPPRLPISARIVLSSDRWAGRGAEYLRSAWTFENVTEEMAASDGLAHYASSGREWLRGAIGLPRKQAKAVQWVGTMSIWNWLLNPSGLTAHGFCLSWAPGLIGLHVVSDAIIGLAYFSIPLALASFVRQRTDLRYVWIIYLFAGFILACGTTHLFSIVTLWLPAYGVEGLVKLLTAALSIATAAILWPLIPKLVALPSPAALQILNGQLSAKMAQVERADSLRRQSEGRLRTLNSELERRVAEQTAELRAANSDLAAALSDKTVALERLARTEDEFRVSFEGAAVGKLHADPTNAKIIRVNTAFAQMLGYEPDDMIGRGEWDFTWPEDLEADQAEYRKALNGDVANYLRETRYRRRDGTPVWGRVSAAIVRSPVDGKPVLTLSVIENIEERYLAQKALRTAVVQLERVVEERTDALKQRDILLREVYHRVKNNLQIIDSLLVLQSKTTSEKINQDALISIRQRIYALGLVHQQLMGSHDLKTFDIAPFLEVLTNNIVEGSSQSGVHLSVNSMPLDVGLDFAIPLGLLVTELVTNSIKHAFPNGIGNIDVVFERGDDGDIKLIVSDDGRGLPADDGAEKNAKAGLGVGIIKGLVNQIGGTMTVDGAHGVRTEIHIPTPSLS